MKNNKTNRIYLDEIIATPDKRYNSFVNSLPPNQRYSKDYNTYRYWQLYGKPNDFSEALKLGMYNLDDDGSYHANSVAYNPYTGEYEFMKSSKHKSLQNELDWYYGNTQDAIEFRKNYDLDTSGEYYKYIPRQSMKVGGSAKGFFNNIGINVRRQPKLNSYNPKSVNAKPIQRNTSFKQDNTRVNKQYVPLKNVEYKIPDGFTKGDELPVHVRGFNPTNNIADESTAWYSKNGKLYDAVGRELTPKPLTGSPNTFMGNPLGMLNLKRGIDYLKGGTSILQRMFLPKVYSTLNAKHAGEMAQAATIARRLVKTGKPIDKDVARELYAQTLSRMTPKNMDNALKALRKTPYYDSPKKLNTILRNTGATPQGFITRDNEIYNLAYNKPKRTILGHEYRHLLDRLIPLSKKHKRLLIDTYKPYWGNQSLNEMVTTNRDIRAMLLAKYNKSLADVEEQNALINSISDEELFDIVGQSNGYGATYLENLPKDKGSIYAPMIRSSLKRIPATAPIIPFMVPNQNNK